ncbi:MAG: MFS transporter [Scytonema sp. PMC 1069.18]|nr:MFS transporter [Scytonema sp. PMC 1069.18]MEC4883316.1 MFS transporter [Scytonema sp. PMC 1070.18]
MTTAPTKIKNTNVFKDKNFYIINSLTLMAILGGTIINPSLPAIAKAFNVSVEQVANVSTLFQLPGTFVTPIFGILADTFGRKQVLVPSLLLFAASGAFSSFAQSFNGLLVWRFLQGVGTSSLESLQLTIIGDLYSGKKLNTVMGFNASLIGISSALFPLIGGLIGLLSWRYPLILSLFAIPIAFLVLTTLRLPRQQTVENFTLSTYLQSTWNSIKNRQVLGLFFAAMSQFMLQVGTLLTFIPLLAGSVLGASEGVIGVLLASMSVSLAIVASQLGRISSHFSEIKLIKFSFFIFALGFVLIPLVGNFWLLFIPVLLLGAAQGLAFPSTQALLAGLAAQESRAGFMSVNSTIQSLGQTLGPFLGAIIVQRWGLRSVFFASAIFALISFAIFTTLLKTKKPRVSAQTQLHSVPMSSVTTLEPSSNVQPASPTLLQPIPQLIHVQTQRAIELPEDFSILRLGKPSDSILPDIDVTEFPNSNVVSRMHAELRFDGQQYYIQDLGSSNGTYINKYPLLPGIWYKLKPGLRFSLGKRELVTFEFQIG